MTELHDNVMRRLRDIEASYVHLTPTPATRRLDARLEALHDLLGELTDAPEAVCRAANRLALDALDEYQRIEREQQEEEADARDEMRSRRAAYHAEAI